MIILAIFLIIFVIILINFGKFQRLVLDAIASKFTNGIFQVKGLEKEKFVVLTIDDGISSKTLEMLNLLNKYNAKATFFIHKNNTELVDNYQSVLNKIIEEKHEFGNHMPEDEPSILLPQEKFASKFEKAHLFLTNLGIKLYLFRAANGFYSVKKMMPSLIKFNYKKQFVMGSFLPWDVFLPFPKMYANQLINNIFSGAIVVFHDGEKNGNQRLNRTLISLEHFLEGMAEKQYQVITLKEALQTFKLKSCT